MNKRNIWLDCIMGVVVGDALGVPVEFSEREELATGPVENMVGYGTFNLPKGSWSDDSSMTLATLDSLKNGFELTDIMNKFVLWLNDGRYTPFGETFDVGNTCCQAILRYIATKDVQTCGGKNENDNGNGSLMRIMPVCLYFYEKQKIDNLNDVEVIEKIHAVSALTHAHQRSKIACGLYYFMIKSILDNQGTLMERLQIGLDAGFGYYEKDVSNLAELYQYRRIRDLNEFIDTEESDIKSSGYVVDTLEAALWCIVNTDTYTDCELKAVNLGHDTDTVAAIAGGLAGLYYGYDEILEEWLEVIQRREWIEEMCKLRDNTYALI
ncbi:ADP-ribosylglycohydrolase family protein [Anaerosporobacter sp.]